MSQDTVSEFVACPACGEPEMCTPEQVRCDFCAEYASVGRFEDMQGEWNGQYWERWE
jgi:hypothetical protein